MADNTASSEQTVRDCEAYIAKHDIQNLLRDCIVQLCLKKPVNPIEFLANYFEKLDTQNISNKKSPMRQQSSPNEQKQQSANGSVAGENDDLADLNESSSHQSQSANNNNVKGRERRGAVSAEPYKEEDATSYVKTVIPKDYATMQALRQHT